MFFFVSEVLEIPMSTLSPSERAARIPGLTPLDFSRLEEAQGEMPVSEITAVCQSIIGSGMRGPINT